VLRDTPPRRAGGHTHHGGNVVNGQGQAAACRGQALAGAAPGGEGFGAGWRGSVSK
jgi:hypothetical protein